MMYQNHATFGTPAARGLVLILVLALAAPAAWCQESAGRFIAVVGDVTVVNPAGSARPASTGASLMTGDTVVTGTRALAQLRLADGALISVRADTRFTLEDFSFKDQADRLGRMFINLVQGSLRSITGLIGKSNREGFRLNTPHATIGVRGTDFETVVLTRPQHGFGTGTLSAVFQGGIFTRNDTGVVDTPVGKAIFVAARNARPTVLPAIPPFLLQGGATQPQGRQGVVKEGPDQAKADEGTARKSVVTKPGATDLPAVQKGATALQSDTKMESATPLLINPLLTPISPTTTTRSPATTTTSPTLISPTLIAPSMTTTTKSLTTTTPEATKSLSTTTSPTTISPMQVTPISPTPTRPATTTVTPTMTVPMMTPISPTMTSPATTITPMTVTPKTISPATTTSPKVVAPVKR